MIGHAEQAIGVGRQIDANHIGAFVRNDIEKSRILMSEAVVILSPDERRDQNIDRRYGRAPVEFFFRFFQPLGVLVEHGIDDVNEGLVAGAKSMTPSENVT